MPHPLDGIRAKLARADQHIKQINDDIIVNRKVRISADSVRARLQLEASEPRDPSTWRKRIVFYLKGNPPPLDLSFTILAGEAVHHLRSALDHLVIAQTKQAPTFKSAFPVVGRGRMKKRVWVSAADEYAAQTSRLKAAISLSAETRIDALQPFHRGTAYNQDLLWMLSELDNAYKHRLLLLTVHRVSDYWVTVSSRGVDIKSSFQPNIRFEDNAEIGRIEIGDSAFSIADADVSVDGDLAVQIAFDEVAGTKAVPVFDCFTVLTSQVRQIVDSFILEFS